MSEAEPVATPRHGTDPGESRASEPAQAWRVPHQAALSGPAHRAREPRLRQPALSVALYLLGVAAVVGALLGGLSLLNHRVARCAAPHGCTGMRHPFVDVGVAVLLGGLVFAVVIFAVGYLCAAVARLHSERRPAGGGGS